MTKIIEGTPIICFQVGHNYLPEHPATLYCLTVDDEGRMVEIVPAEVEE